MSTQRQNCIRVFLVDDHPIVIEGIKCLLENDEDLQVVGWSYDATDATKKIGEILPDVVVVDISLEKMSGLDLTEVLVQRYPDLRVLVFSMHDESLYAERALVAGAKGYVMKKEGHKKLLTAIRDVLAGKFFLSEKMNEFVLQKLYNNSPVDADPVASLSNRELEVLQMTGHGLSGKEIAGKLCISPSTVDTYKSKIKTKLNLRNSYDLLRYAVQWAR